MFSTYIAHRVCVCALLIIELWVLYLLGRELRSWVNIFFLLKRFMSTSLQDSIVFHMASFLCSKIIDTVFLQLCPAFSVPAFFSSVPGLGTHTYLFLSRAVV